MQLNNQDVSNRSIAILIIFGLLIHLLLSIIVSIDVEETIQKEIQKCCISTDTSKTVTR